MAVIKDTAFILSIQKHLAPELRIRLLPGREIAMAKTVRSSEKLFKEEDWGRMESKRCK